MGNPNEKKTMPANTSMGMRRAKDLGILRHLEIFESVHIPFDLDGIADPDRPSVEVITGLLFRTLPDDKTRVIVLAPKEGGSFESQPGVRRGGRGDLLKEMDVHIVAAWSRFEDGKISILDQDDQPWVFPATPLAFYQKGRCTIPERPITGVVNWQYRDGHKIEGRFLPYDLDAANREGWFNLQATQAAVITSLSLWPVMSRVRRGRVEGQTLHPSGTRIISKFPMLTPWGQPSEVGLIQNDRVIGAIPLPSLGTEEAETVVEELGMERGETDVEVGPHEVRVGKITINIWDKIATVDSNITPMSTLPEIRSAFRQAGISYHPDQIQGRLAKAGMSAKVIEASVKTAATQWWPIDASFKKAIAIREEEIGKMDELVATLTLADVLGGKTIEDVRKIETDFKDVGELRKVDIAAQKVAAVLGVEHLSWHNNLHMELRKRLLDRLVAKAKAAAEAAKVIDEPKKDGDGTPEEGGPTGSDAPPTAADGGSQESAAPA